MTVTGTLVNYYIHCKRQCFLAGNRINMEDNSELVKIGKALHEAKDSGVNTEVSIDKIKVDKIKGDYLIEYKKSNSDLDACKWQVLFYLSVLKSKGIDKKGKLVCMERANKSEKTVELALSEETERQLERICDAISELISSPFPPEAKRKPFCNKCAYYAYCFV